MPAKLKVSKETEPQKHNEYLFEKDIIFIGRGIKNDLQLHDARKVVGREHAKIKRQDDSYKIIDLNSMNFTFLNGKKLKAGVEYDLENGDQIKISEFIIQFTAERIEIDQKTIISPEYLNPFAKDSHSLAKILHRICNEYDLEESGRKDQVLQETLKKSIGALKLNKASEIIANVLHTQKDTAYSPIEKSDLDLKAPQTSDSIQSLIDILLGHFVKLIQAYRNFRVEFLGETDVQAISIYRYSVEELKNFFFDPSNLPQDSLKRIKQIEAISEELMLHQISLLEGYKASVIEGAKLILEKINPDVLKKQLANKKLALGRITIRYALFPVLKVFKLVQLFSATHQELSREDQSIIEAKYFRHRYIKSYYKHMDKARKKNRKSYI